MNPWSGGTVIRDVEVGLPSSLEEVMEFLEPRIHFQNEGRVYIRTFNPYGDQSGIQELGIMDIDPTTAEPEEVGVRLLAAHTISLDGKQRFNLANGTQSGPLNGPPTNHWMALERDDAIYSQVDSMVEAAFDQHLVIQTFEPPNLRPALSPFPLPDDLRHDTSPQAVAFQESTTPIDALSDGVQVFCGLVAAVAALPHLLLLIDEPEAFLHPTLSRRLGSNLARIARERDARLIAATHSADFLMGCLEEVPQTTVVRLDFRSGVAASHAMSAGDVADLSRDPLLRSADALQAMFARSAVVCEADPDRAFYEEINRRLLGDLTRTGAKDSEFLNAQNWQTTVRLAAPLRAAGVPAALILDLDTLANDDAWPEIVGMGALNSLDRDRILTARTEARDAIVECGRVASGGPLRVKASGMEALNEEQRPIVEAGLLELAAIGVFVVNVGELENWLSQFGCSNKRTWVTDILIRLGTPDDAAHVTPGPGDVWDFVEGVATWLEDPGRSGMPAT